MGEAKQGQVHLDMGRFVHMGSAQNLGGRNAGEDGPKNTPHNAANGHDANTPYAFSKPPVSIGDNQLGSL